MNLLFRIVNRQSFGAVAARGPQCVEIAQAGAGIVAASTAAAEYAETGGKMGPILRALGVLFYLMLAGRTPFDADNNAAILYKHVNIAPRPLDEVLAAGHDVPRGLVELVMQCLEKDPEGRPADADAMVEALIDCVPSSLFHLPVADGSPATSGSTATSGLTGSTGSLISMLAPAVNASGSGVQPMPDVSSANLERPGDVGERPATLRRTRSPTQNKLRPPTHGKIRPPTLPPGASLVSAMIRLDALGRPAKRNSWGIILGSAAALLAGGLLAAVYVLGDRGGDTRPAAVVAGAEGHQPSRAHATEILDRVDGEILAGEFDRARASLDAATADIDAFPELSQRAGRQRDRIAVATTFANAQRLEKDGKLAAALGAYQDLLAIDPTHVDARAAVARLGPAVNPSPTVLLPPGSKQAPVVRRGGKPGKPGEPAPNAAPNASLNDPATPPVPRAPPETPPEEDPFLPVARQDDDGIFLPVGGNK